MVLEVHYGIGLKAIFEIRKPSVCYIDISSVTMPITHGVHQGSILGSLLFILYINDLVGVSEKLFTILLADDTTIMIEYTHVNSMITSLNSELAKLTEWIKTNKLSFNVSKTHYMVFHRSRLKLDKGDILLNNTIVKQVSFTKFIGIIIDDKLKWIHTISYMKNKIYNGMGIILKARIVLKKSVLLQLYHSFVIPYLIYCVEIWGNASDIHLHQLITTHNLKKNDYLLLIFFSYKNYI